MRRPRGATPDDIAASDRFLTKMSFLSATEEERILTLLIDCFFFQFGEGFTADVQYRMFQYMKTLDLTDQRAIVKLWIWLKQQRVTFWFEFQWNGRLPIWYNLLKVGDIRRLKKSIAGVKEEDIMAYDLSKDTYALHK